MGAVPVEGAGAGRLGGVGALQGGVQCLFLQWVLVAPGQKAASCVTGKISPGVRSASQLYWQSLESQ